MSGGKYDWTQLLQSPAAKQLNLAKMGDSSHKRQPGASICPRWFLQSTSPYQNDQQFWQSSLIPPTTLSRHYHRWFWPGNQRDGEKMVRCFKLDTRCALGAVIRRALQVIAILAWPSSSPKRAMLVAGKLYSGRVPLSTAIAVSLRGIQQPRTHIHEQRTRAQRKR